MYFVVMPWLNHIVIIVVMYWIFICQLPACNLFTQHVSYLIGETPLVNCGPRSILLHRIQSTAIFVLLFFANIIIHTIHLILCYSKPVRLTTSLFRWGKVLWLCFAGSTLAPESLVLRRTTSRRHQPSTCFLTPTGSIKHWFLTEGNLPLCASHLPLGVPNGRVNYTHQANFWRRCRGDQDTLQGESPLPISLLCFCLALLYFIYCFVCSLYQKYKKLVASFTLFTVLFSIAKTQKKLVTCIYFIYL